MTLTQSPLHTWTPTAVQEAADAHAADGPPAFAEYARQELGVPYPTYKDMTVLRRSIKQFFGQYERADYYTLCRIVQWAKNRHKRFNRIFKLLEAYRDAWVQGALPELDPQNIEADVEVGIELALETETDEEWRKRLILAAGPDARRLALADWKAERG